MYKTLVGLAVVYVAIGWWFVYKCFADSQGGWERTLQEEGMFAYPLLFFILTYWGVFWLPAAIMSKMVRDDMLDMSKQTFTIRLKKHNSDDYEYQETETKVR